MDMPISLQSRSGSVTIRLLMVLFTCPFAGYAQDAHSPAIGDLEKNEFHVGSNLYSIVNGDAFQYSATAGKWTLIDHLYDPDFFAKNYVAKDGVIYRRDESSGTLHAVSKHFASGFEYAGSLRDLIGEKPGWTSFILQSPRAPTVADYVRLRTGIGEGRLGSWTIA